MSSNYLFLVMPLFLHLRVKARAGDCVRLCSLWVGLPSLHLWSASVVLLHYYFFGRKSKFRQRYVYLFCLCSSPGVFPVFVPHRQPILDRYRHLCGVIGWGMINSREYRPDDIIVPFLFLERVICDMDGINELFH